EALVRQHLKQHGDDPQKSLAGVSSIESGREQLNQIADSDLHASVAQPSGVAEKGDALLRLQVGEGRAAAVLVGQRERAPAAARPAVAGPRRRVAGDGEGEKGG